MLKGFDVNESGINKIPDLFTKDFCGANLMVYGSTASTKVKKSCLNFHHARHTDIKNPASAGYAMSK